ncbi:MAG: alpha-glucan family phosphorylase [Promethearchaeota archaeon]
MTQFESVPQDIRKIAYFSMEIGLASDVPTYSGGLGVLAGDTLRSCADLEVPLVAITLAYDAGYFYQIIDSDGNQIEHDIRWEFEAEFERVNKTVEIEVQGKPVKIGAWYYELEGITGFNIPVYLLDSDVEGNEDWQKRFTHVLYDATPFQRIVQEMILGIAGVRLIQSLGYDIKTYHMNEGHSSFLTLELYNQNNGDLNATRDKCVFTTHTPVPAGHDVFNYDLVHDVFRDYLPDNIHDLAGKDQLNMTLLGMNMSRYVNAVSKKHGVIAREMFPNYEIDSITNGIHHLFWVSPYLRELFDRKFPAWRYHPSVLTKAHDLDSGDLWDAHLKAKIDLLDYQKSHSYVLMDENLLTIGFARRFTGYKRPDLILTDLDRLGRIIGDRAQIIFAGKTHPRDIHGKQLIKMIFEKSDELWDKYKARISFLSNYDMDLARLMVAGCDLWLNTPMRYLEASGTSGMKAALNGVLNFSILDGWWLEGYKLDKMAGWSINPQEIDPSIPINDNLKEAEYLYDKLEKEIIPLFFSNNNKRYFSEGWVERMKHAISIASFFNTNRMVMEYAKKAWRLKHQPHWGDA